MNSNQRQIRKLLSSQRLNVAAKKKTNTRPPWKQSKRLSSARETRTFHSGPLLDLVGTHVDGAYRQGHARVNQGGSARDQLLRAGIVYKHLAPVRFSFNSNVRKFT